MLVMQVILAVIGLSAGALVAGGLFGFVVSLGVVSDFADRTHTGHKILLYEDVIMLGAIAGNIGYLYQIQLPRGPVLLVVFGLLSGIFVGCWAMALTEILNVFPIFIRRTKILKAVPYLISCIAIGKGVGSLIYFFFGW